MRCGAACGATRDSTTPDAKSTCCDAIARASCTHHAYLSLLRRDSQVGIRRGPDARRPRSPAPPGAEESDDDALQHARTRTLRSPTPNESHDRSGGAARAAGTGRPAPPPRRTDRLTRGVRRRARAPYGRPPARHARRDRAPCPSGRARAQRVTLPGLPDARARARLPADDGSPPGARRRAPRRRSPFSRRPPRRARGGARAAQPSPRSLTLPARQRRAPQPPLDGRPSIPRVSRAPSTHREPTRSERRAPCHVRTGGGAPSQRCR